MSLGMQVLPEADWILPLWWGWPPLNAAGTHSTCKLLRAPSGHCYAEGFIKYPMMNISPRLLLPRPWSTPVMPPADLISTLLSSAQQVLNTLFWFCPWWHPGEVVRTTIYLVRDKTSEEASQGGRERNPPGYVWICLTRWANPEGSLVCELCIATSVFYHQFSKLNLLHLKLGCEQIKTLSLINWSNANQGAVFVLHIIEMILLSQPGTVLPDR